MSTTRPPKPVTSYRLFVREKIEQIKNEKPKMSAVDIAVRCGQMWRQLSASELSDYKQRAEEARERYSKSFFKHHEPTAKPEVKPVKEKGGGKTKSMQSKKENGNQK